MKIVNLDGRTIYESAHTLVDAVEEAVAEGVSLLRADFRGANCRWADFSGADCGVADFRDADCGMADFRDADCTNADFREANCRGADFRGANCHWADFSGAYVDGAKFDLDDVPRIHDIHRRVYEAASLYMDLWHTRAEWVVKLAGEEGRELEKRLGTSTAAALIYVASDPYLERVPDFYASDKEALEDMRRLANQ